MRGGPGSWTLVVGALTLTAALAGCGGAPWDTSNPSRSAATSREAGLSASPSHTVPTPPGAAPSETFAAIPGLPDLRFPSGRATVDKPDYALLDEIVLLLKENPHTRLVIEGHTDDLGSRQANLAVGEKRAESARAYLIEKDIEPDRVSVVSYGPDRPLCRQKSSECRAKNRRIHFVLSPRND